jgi:hypothetical protein
MIVKAAKTIKKPADVLDYSEVKEAWKHHRRAFWIANPQQAEPDDPEAWEQFEQQSLDGFFIYLRDRQILFQGHQWTCPQCHHRNWVDLSALGPELKCEVCKKKEKTPIEISWLFRPNEFLVESLRDHSVLSLIWVMNALCRRARRSCIFVEPTAFGFTESEKIDAEVDLLAVIDGEAIVSEIKSSWESLRTSDIDDLVNISIRLRPNTSLLAVMATGQGPTTKIESARETLRLQNIKLEVLTLDQFGLEDSPQLYLTE